MKRSGQTAYRCLIPMKDILADEETNNRTILGWMQKSLRA